MPNANVFPLPKKIGNASSYIMTEMSLRIFEPVSAAPKISRRPIIAAGNVSACISVGSLNSFSANTLKIGSAIPNPFHPFTIKKTKTIGMVPKLKWK